MITVYRISQCKFIEDLSGEGAFRYGARWNSAGTRLLYTAENAALAMLEALAHITMLPLKEPYCMARISIPDDVADICPSSLPANWNIQPPPDLLAAIGDSFCKKGENLAAKVPSVLMPENFNYLINPLHPLFSKIKLVAITNISFDQRLVRTGS